MKVQQLISKAIYYFWRRSFFSLCNLSINSWYERHTKFVWGNHSIWVVFLFIQVIINCCVNTLSNHRSIDHLQHNVISCTMYTERFTVVRTDCLASSWLVMYGIQERLFAQWSCVYDISLSKVALADDFMLCLILLWCNTIMLRSIVIRIITFSV